MESCSNNKQVKQTKKMCYKRFWDNLLLKYNIKEEELITWTYAGWFSNDIESATDAAHIYNGKRRWRDEMGDLELPYHLKESHCVCEVEIIWNHILVDDPYADEPQIIIIGSECIDKFLKIDRRRKCSNCGVSCSSRKEVALCPPCLKESKRRKCVRCNRNMPKGKRGIYCCNYCKDPDWNCFTCGNRKKFKSADTCAVCYYRSKG